jgi:hypothetical protein
MPRKNGIQVVEALRNYIKGRNSSLSNDKIELVEPRIVFVTAFLSLNFMQHLQALNIMEAYEKPI